MVRGISTRWKKPVEHFFIGNSVAPAILKKMILWLIATLEAMKLTVIAVVCDQEAAHRSCLKSLRVAQMSPNFSSESGSKVYAMHDVPHLAKNITNNLLIYDFTIDDQTVCFKHIKHLYELESKSTLSLVPKLTKEHLEIKMFWFVEITDTFYCYIL